MKRKDYEKPAMRVVKIQQHAHLLVGSGTNGSRSPYGDPTNWDWE